MIWYSGRQASLNIQCERRKAWVQMTSSLGHPKAPHSPRCSVPRNMSYAAPASHHGSHGPPPPVYTHHDAHGHAQPHLRRKGPRQLERDRRRAEAHRRKMDSLPAEHPQPEHLTPEDPPPQPHQLTLPVAGHPADDGDSTPQLPLPSFSAHPHPTRRKSCGQLKQDRTWTVRTAVRPQPAAAPPPQEGHVACHRAGHPADPPQAVSPVWPPHYQEVDITLLKKNNEGSPPPDLQPSSPCNLPGLPPSDDSEEKSRSPILLHMWQSPKPARTGPGPKCPPDPPPAHHPFSDSSQSPLPQAVCLHQVIEALHQRAAQPSPSRVATPWK